MFETDSISKARKRQPAGVWKRGYEGARVPRCNRHHMVSSGIWKCSQSVCLSICLSMQQSPGSINKLHSSHKCIKCIYRIVTHNWSPKAEMANICSGWVRNIKINNTWRIRNTNLSNCIRKLIELNNQIKLHKNVFINISHFQAF